MAKPLKHVFICSQSRPPGHPRGACSQKGAQEILQTFWQEVQQRNLFDQVAVTFSGCIGPCDQGANVLVYPEGVLYNRVSKGDVKTIVEEHLIGGNPVASLQAPAEIW